MAGGAARAIREEISVAVYNHHRYRICSARHVVPTLYLESTAVACYEAGRELSANLASIFGANDRSEKFYARYGECVSRGQLAAAFLSKGGVEAMSAALNFYHEETGLRIPLDLLWPAAAVVPCVFCEASLDMQEGNVAFFKDVVVKRIQNLTGEERAGLAALGEETSFFLENLGRMLRMKYSEEETRRVVRVVEGGLSSSPQHVPAAHVPIPVQDLGAPFSRVGVSAEEEDSRAAQIAAVRRLNEEVALCRKEILTVKEQISDIKSEFHRAIASVEHRNYKKATAAVPEDKAYLQAGAEAKTCDESERAVLDTIEALLDQNRTEAVLELIAFRQDLLRQSHKHVEDIDKLAHERNFADSPATDDLVSPLPHEPCVDFLDPVGNEAATESVRHGVSNGKNKLAVARRGGRVAAGEDSCG